MAFPTSPTNNQTATVNGIVYLYSSADNAWTRFSSPPGNLTVTSNLTSSGNLIASNVYLSSLFWSNGAPIALGYGNTQVAAYLTTGTIAITDLSVGDSLVQQDALNLNNNNLYGVNTIRINDPGTSEGISWEGGSGWNIYESPDDLSNNTGNLQIVLSGTRVFTVDTNQNINIPSTWAARSTTSGALTVAGGVGIGGNLWVGGDIYASNLISIGSTTLTVTDPLLYLSASDLTPYNYDIGFFSHFIGGSLDNYQHTGFSRNSADNTWTLFSNVFSEPGVTINWTEANIIYDPIKVGSANVANTTVSTSTTTGALVVGGGVGIGGALYIANTGDVSANIGSYQTYANTNAAIITTSIDTVSANLGAYQIYANANIGAYQVYANANAAAQTSSLDLINANIGAFYTYANTKIGTNTNSNLVIQSTAQSTSAVTGALVVAGGVGVAGNIYSADRIFTTTGIYWSSNNAVYGGTPAGSNQQIQYNNGGAFGASSGLIYDGVSLKVNGNLESTYHSGDEGGEIFLQKPDTNTTLAAGVTIDIFQNKLRFFENGGTNRGFYLDITSGGATVGTNLISGGGGGGTPAGSTGDIQYNNGGAFGSTSLFYDSGTGNIVLTDTTTSTSTTTGALVVKGGVGVAGNVVADKLYTTQGLYWAGNGVAFSSSSYGNTEVAAYLPIYSGNIQAGNASIITNLSVAPGLSNNDALNLNNNNLYNVNNIRISDPGNSEGISWEGGSGWSIYESPDDLSNDIGNLQIVLSSTRTLTVTTSGTVDIPGTTDAISKTTGVLTLGGGIGVAGNVYANAIYTTTGIRWAGNGVAFSSGGGGGSGLNITTGTTAPVSPSVGDQWYATDLEILFEYLDDGDSQQWVDITSSAIAANSSINLSAGDLSVLGHVTPGLNSSYDLGNVSYKWRNLYIGNQAILANASSTSGYFWANGAPAFYSNLWVAQYLPTYTGNLTAGNINSSGILTTSGNITGDNLTTGIISATGSITGASLTTGIIVASGNITSGNLTTGIVTASGNITGTNLTTGIVTASGNITGTNLTTGIVTASGNITGGNLTTGIISATGSITTSGNLTFAGTVTGGAIKYMFEGANVIAASPPSVTDINVISGAIQYWTSNASTNFTANIRGDDNTPLNNLLGIGQSSTIALIIPQATAYYVTTVKVDNVTITPVWQGGTTVASGNANSIDLYTFTVIKTADATFKVFASQTKYQHTG